MPTESSSCPGKCWTVYRRRWKKSAHGSGRQWISSTAPSSRSRRHASGLDTRQKGRLTGTKNQDYAFSDSPKCVQDLLVSIVAANFDDLPGLDAYELTHRLGSPTPGCDYSRLARLVSRSVRLAARSMGSLLTFPAISSARAAASEIACSRGSARPAASAVAKASAPNDDLARDSARSKAVRSGKCGTGHRPVSSRTAAAAPKSRAACTGRSTATASTARSAREAATSSQISASHRSWRLSRWTAAAYR